ncbi:GNAT family N-acetyltransferase [Parasphingorhabdus halotolerans]|uniref:GNAT family N-acetyltransferase n=1 Tax=Parasphingorhabdus halotolerans TaxID=2725558 RepID=A0A6H2DL53_9SPHN|nr:GNAT family N-acetyltransferase [Parasphingorhabdus halotolerans]QJB68386.1 GNAT family N-acetyltransferase [Parasphingorhabdus halotolerans]
MVQSHAIVWIDTSNRSLLDDVAEGVFDKSIQTEFVDVYLANAMNWLAVAVVDGLIVGQCMSVVLQTPDKGTEIFLNEIGTGDVWRRKGIADSLIAALFDRADEAGIDEIWLGTEPDNLAARGLYKKHAATQEDAVIYYLDW